MAGLVPAIHALSRKEDVDGRDKPGHDGVRVLCEATNAVRENS